MFLCFVIGVQLKAMARSIFKLNDFLKIFIRMSFFLFSLVLSYMYIKKSTSMPGDSITSKHQTVKVVQCLIPGPDKQIPMV